MRRQYGIYFFIAKYAFQLHSAISFSCVGKKYFQNIKRAKAKELL